ncbi:MAG TPA: PD-(D/E)XK nuclease family protein, partial [Smithella sp.]|nr:PD-(D/E)XK nuclease family protein [Smithella sp.]
LPGVAWKISSYSSLTASSLEGGRQHEPATQDYDVIPLAIEDHDPPQVLRAKLSGDIIDFPAGTTTGHCLHAVFERIDFQDESGWKDIITNVLANYPPVDALEKRDDQVSRIHGMLKDVMSTPLPTGFKLGDVARAKRFSEFEFAYSVRHLDHAKLKNLLDKHGCRIPPLDFPDLEGYLRGFIDLVFEHAGKWYVLDWKSNKLGISAAEYSRSSVDEAMFNHAYEFQGLIYLIALHRYLKLRISKYDYSRHMGGILYLFVRGVRPAWPSAGIWHKLPEPALIESLDALFSSENRRTV